MNSACKELDYIRSVMDENHLSLTWIADELNRMLRAKIWNRQKVYSVKHTLKEINISTYKLFKKLFDKYNFTAPHNEELHPLIDSVTDLALQSTIINKETVLAMIDGELSFDEREKIITEIKIAVNLLKRAEEEIRKTK